MTHASLFSGIGGPEVAASMLGWDNLFHCEINEFFRRILDYWFPNSKSYEDITKTDFSGWRGKVDVLTGGFPCQPFSYAGKRRGADDDRYLWPQMLRVIGEVRPAWVVGENVAGITTMVEQGGAVVEMESQASLFGEGDGVHRYKYRQPFTIERVCSDLEGLGYSVQPVLIPACAVGAPHRRDRVFIVAMRIEDTDLSGSDGRCNSADSDGVGRGERRCETDKREHDRIRSQVFGIAERHGSGGTSADTKGECGQRHRPRQSEVGRAQQEQSGGRGGEDDAERNAADTYGERSNQPNASSKPGKKKRLDNKEDHTSGTAGLGRWDSFPSVSPVHRGNDGIPFDVDRLAIPFSKWRTESLKAYGNAIVPQVMYEIFRFIEIVEKGEKQ